MKTATLHDYKARLLLVLTHIRENLDASLSLESLAQMACLSPYHFHRVFSGMVGESIQAHIRRLRLERAARELHDSTEPIIQIALAAGYQTHESFSRIFAQSFRMSPSKFRRNPNATPLLPAPSGIHFLPHNHPTRFRTLPPAYPTMNASVKSITPFTIACLRHIGPYDQCGPTWDRVGELLGAEGYLGPDTRVVGVSYDDPDTTPAAQIRFDAGFSVDPDFTPFDDLEVRHIRGGDYARMTHHGPYQSLGETYRDLMGRWIPRSGRELADAPCFEVYLNDPDATEPAELLTDIYAPLQ